MKFSEANPYDLFSDACIRAKCYLESIPDRRVAPAPEHVQALAQLGGPMPVNPQEPSEILRMLDEIGSPATVASNAGRYFGFVNGAALPVCVASQWLSSAWDQNVGLRVMSPATAAIEDIVLSWLIDLFRLPTTCGAALVTGATMANFSGLAAARHRLLANCGWDVEAAGLFGAPPLHVIVGEEAHVTVRKALGLLGLGRQRVTVVPADSQGRILAAAIPPLDDRTIVCLQAGNVNTGACDRIREICKRANEADAWVHIDGAFGLWARVDPRREHLVDGLELADSWATDAHKWLNVPYDCGVAFVRDRAALRAAMTATAAYLLESGEREPMHYTPESSRRARCVDVWAALRFFGRSGLADLVNRACEHAKRFAAKLAEGGFKTLNEVALNQVLVSFGDAADTQAVIAEVQADGTCWCGGTRWQGHTAMRISVSSWMTTTDDVDRSVDAILAAARRVRRRPTFSREIASSK